MVFRDPPTSGHDAGEEEQDGDGTGHERGDERSTRVLRILEEERREGREDGGERGHLQEIVGGGEGPRPVVQHIVAPVATDGGALFEGGLLDDAAHGAEDTRAEEAGGDESPRVDEALAGFRG